MIASILVVVLVLIAYVLGLWLGASHARQQRGINATVGLSRAEREWQRQSEKLDGIIRKQVDLQDRISASLNTVDKLLARLVGP